MRAHGTDRLKTGPDGSWILVCELPKGWAARRARTHTSPEHPGTAVRAEGEIFEVVEALAEPSGGVRYTLRPWEDRHTVRVLERYDAESEGARLREAERRQGALRLRRTSFLLAPLLGLLPAEVQQRMEEECGAPARAMTIASALPLFALGVLGLLAVLVDFAGGGAVFAGWPILPLPVALYLAVESALRLGIAFAQDEPAGSLVGILTYRAWQALAGRRRGASGG